VKRARRIPTPEKPYVIFATALNYFDPDQRRMIEHVEARSNTSAYLQRLIQRDMEGGVGAIKMSPVSEDFDTGLMRSLI
jgi:hypothetical protein